MGGIFPPFKQLKNIMKTNETIYYARKCSITNEGMNEGWVWCESAFYTSTLELTYQELRKDREQILEIADEIYEDNTPIYDKFGTAYNLSNRNLQDESRWEEFNKAMRKAKQNKETDEDLLEIAYQIDYIYWTDWYSYEEDECDYKEVNGKLIEL